MPACPTYLWLCFVQAERAFRSFVRPSPLLSNSHVRVYVAQAGVPCYLQCYRDATVEEGEGGLFSFSFPFGAR